MGERKEIAWINNVRALCMMFVYLQHCEFYIHDSTYVSRPIYQLFYVNAFFLVSGYLFFRKQLSSPVIDEPRKVFIKTDGKRLFENIVFKILLPTVLFGLLFFVPKLVIRDTPFSLEYLCRDVFLGGWSWFTATLFVSELFLLVLLVTRQKNLWFYSVATLIGTFAVFMLPRDTNYVWYYQSGVFASLILVLGGFFWKYEDKTKIVLDNIYVNILMLFTYLAVVYSYGNKLICDVSTLHVSPLGAPMALLSSILVINICKRIPDNSVMNFIGKHSLVFYMLSGGLPNIVAILLRGLGIPYGLKIVFATVLSLLLATGITWFVNKYIPFLVDLRNLKRKKI